MALTVARTIASYSQECHALRPLSCSFVVTPKMIYLLQESPKLPSSNTTNEHQGQSREGNVVATPENITMELQKYEREVRLVKFPQNTNDSPKECPNARMPNQTFSSKTSSVTHKPLCTNNPIDPVHCTWHQRYLITVTEPNRRYSSHQGNGPRFTCLERFVISSTKINQDKKVLSRRFSRRHSIPLGWQKLT